MAEVEIVSRHTTVEVEFKLNIYEKLKDITLKLPEPIKSDRLHMVSVTIGGYYSPQFEVLNKNTIVVKIQPHDIMQGEKNRLYSIIVSYEV